MFVTTMVGAVGEQGGCGIWDVQAGMFKLGFSSFSSPNYLLTRVEDPQLFCLGDQYLDRLTCGGAADADHEAAASAVRHGQPPNCLKRTTPTNNKEITLITNNC